MPVDIVVTIEFDTDSLLWSLRELMLNGEIGQDEEICEIRETMPEPANYGRDWFWACLPWKHGASIWFGNSEPVEGSYCEQIEFRRMKYRLGSGGVVWAWWCCRDRKIYL